MAISARNAVALVSNALRHVDLTLRQDAVRRIAPDVPYEPRPAPGSSTALAEIPSGRTLLVVGQATEPNVTRSMSDYTAAMGRPGGYSFYLILSGDVVRTRRELATMGAFLDRYPGTALLLAVGYGASLTGNIRESQLLLRGRFDPELDALAAWLKGLDRAAFVRPLYEFDRMGMTYGGPELFKSAYRYFVDRVRGHGLHNTAWVWQSAGPVWRLVGSATRYAIASAVGRLPGLADWYVKRYFDHPVRERRPGVHTVARALAGGAPAPARTCAPPLAPLPPAGISGPGRMVPARVISRAQEGTMPDSQPCTANDLLRMPYGAVMDLFHSLPAATIDEMNGEYRADLLDQGPPAFLWLALWVVHLKGRWLAKAFTPEGPAGGRGYNVFIIGDRVVRGTRMRTSVGPSQHDGRPSFRLDYSAYMKGPLGTMRDEVRRVAEGLYLGVGTAGYTRWMRRPSPFLLEGPVAPFAD